MGYDTRQAREAAADWHGGQCGALHTFSAVGDFDGEGMLRELGAARREPYFAGLPVGRVEAFEQLEAYVTRRNTAAGR